MDTKLEELSKRLHKEFNFKGGAERNFPRDKFKCVYCGKDFLKNFDAYELSTVDHLLPKGKLNYPELEFKINNMVLCCHICNRLKHIFDPNKNDPKYKKGDGDLNDTQRELFIERAKEFIKKQRDEKTKEFERIKELWEQYNLDHK